MKESGNLRVGLFGIGLAAYWEQFPGLEERLKASVRVVEERASRPGPGGREPRPHRFS